MARETVNMHEAKTHLSRLVEKAAKGESIILAKAGKPMVRVVAIDRPKTHEVQRLGFLRAQFSVPADFDRMGEHEIAELFRG